MIEPDLHQSSLVIQSPARVVRTSSRVTHSSCTRLHYKPHITNTTLVLSFWSTLIAKYRPSHNQSSYPNNDVSLGTIVNYPFERRICRSDTSRPTTALIKTKASHITISKRAYSSNSLVPATRRASQIKASIDVCQLQDYSTIKLKLRRLPFLRLQVLSPSRFVVPV